MPSFSSALKKLVPRVLRGRRTVVKASEELAPLDPPSVGFPLGNHDNLPIPQVAPARQERGVNISSLLRRPSNHDVASSDTPCPHQQVLSVPRATSSVDGNVGSDGSHSCDSPRATTQSTSASLRERASLRSRLGAILSQGSHANRSPRPTESPISLHPLSPLSPERPPGLPIPPRAEPFSASAHPWLGRYPPAVPVRPPVPNTPVSPSNPERPPGLPIPPRAVPFSASAHPWLGRYPPAVPIHPPVPNTPVSPSNPERTPGLPIPPSAVPVRDAAQPWPPRCHRATVRPPVHDSPAQVHFIGRTTTTHSPATDTRTRPIFSPDLQAEIVGAGSYGTVFKVVSRAQNRTTVRAVKVVDLTRANELRALPLCSQEIKILKHVHRLQSQYGRASEDEEDDRDHRGLKHIVKFARHENFIGVSGQNYLYIAMEYYPFSLVPFVRRLNADELALRFIISQVTVGLNYLHSIGIIHMDLKPDNIFVSPKGNCVIGDFGGSFYNPESGSEDQFWSGAHTAGFVAPEVIAARCSQRSISTKCDFFSLGVSIYDIVVFHELFNSQLTHREMRLEPKAMEECMELYGCPDLVVYMVKCMCRHDPKLRWGGRQILDFLARNYDPLPSESPLLDYFPPETERQAIRIHEPARTPLRFDRATVKHALGHRLPLIEQVTSDCIL